MIGTPVTTDVGTSSPYGTVVPFSTNITITFTPVRTRKFRVSFTGPMYTNRAGVQSGVRIAATAGSPTILFSQEIYKDGANEGSETVTTSLIAALTAGTSYTFEVQGSTSATPSPAALLIFGGRVGGGVALIAEEIE